MKRKILFLIFAVILSFGIFAENRYALVIGNSNYRHLPKLKNPENDAVAISRALKELEFNVLDTILNGTRSEILSGVRTMRNRISENGGTGLIYYAGHAIEFDGINYLIPVEANVEFEEDVQDVSVSLNSIIDRLDIPDVTNLYFLDSCRDNPLEGRIKTRNASLRRGLAVVSAPSNTLIVYATRPGDAALDGDGANSPFTEALLRHIDTPNEDIEIMLRSVTEDVKEITNNSQVPWKEGGLSGEGFMFNPDTEMAEQIPIMFMTEPSARIIIDDVEVGETPMRIGLTRGQHAVKFIRSGYYQEQRTISVNREDTHEINLREIEHTLSISGTPRGAIIQEKINGDWKRFATLPVSSRSITPGEHEFRIDANGYAESIVTVYIDPDTRRTNNAINLEPVTATVTINKDYVSGESNQTVYINDERIGTAPLTTQIPAENVTLRIGSMSREMFFNPNGQYSVNPKFNFPLELMNFSPGSLIGYKALPPKPELLPESENTIVRTGVKFNSGEIKPMVANAVSGVVMCSLGVFLYRNAENRYNAGEIETEATYNDVKSVGHLCLGIGIVQLSVAPIIYFVKKFSNNEDNFYHDSEKIVLTDNIEENRLRLEEYQAVVDRINAENNVLIQERKTEIDEENRRIRNLNRSRGVIEISHMD